MVLSITKYHFMFYLFILTDSHYIKNKRGATLPNKNGQMYVQATHPTHSLCDRNI